MNTEEKIACARRVIEIEMQAVQSLSDSLDASFSKAIDLMSAAVDNKGKIIVIGVGKSGNISLKIAATLNSTGSTAVVLDSQNARHGDLGIINDGDVILALSYSGETAELIELIPFLKRFDVKIIGITGKKDSSLASYSDVALLTPIEREACPLQLAPTSSSTAALVMGDALAMVLLESRGFTEEDFARYHPGGALGRALLTTVAEIMRSGDKLATLGLDATVDSAIAAMSSCRAGACLILNQDQTLAGIFTHGDFARAFQSHANISGSLVVDFMTTDPITVEAKSLAAEAVQKIGKHNIDDVVVIDEGKPVGLVDTQDFATLKLI